MWAVSYASAPMPRIYLNPRPATTPRSCLSFTVSAGKPAANAVGGLGLTVLTAIESDPKAEPTRNAVPIPQKRKPKQENKKEQEWKEITGADVPWALQKLGAKRNKENSGKNKNKNKKKSNTNKGLFNANTNVRLFSVKSEWVGKLDELEKRP